MADDTQRVALVTGASSGIGRASAAAFAAKGYRLCLASRDVKAAEQALEEACRDGGSGVVVRTDVTDEEQVRKAVSVAVESFGRLDCAFNNAGVEGAFRKTADLTAQEFEDVLAVNLTGVWLCMKHELQAMLGQDHPAAIVNMASVNALKGAPESAAYCASKAGVLGLTRAAAVDYGDSNVRINALVAGAFRTPMLERVGEHIEPGKGAETAESFAERIPQGRLGDPLEAARAAVWLCSDEASYVHGSCFAVDGGLSAI